MKKYKFEYLSFNLYNFQSLNLYFEKKALEGWKVHRIYGRHIIYKKIEPQKLYYNVDLFPVSQISKYIFNQKAKEYLEICKESGWQFIDMSGYYYIFCSTKPIFPLHNDQRTIYDNISRFKFSEYSSLFFMVCLFLLSTFLFKIPLNFHILESYTPLIALPIYLFIIYFICHKVKEVIDFNSNYKKIKSGLEIKAKEVKDCTKLYKYGLGLFCVSEIGLIIISQRFDIIIPFIFSIVYIIFCIVFGDFLGKLAQKNKKVEKYYFLIATVVIILCMFLGVKVQSLIEHQPYYYQNHLQFEDKGPMNYFIDATNSSSMFLSEYNYCYQKQYTSTFNQELEERYYFCRSEKIADFIFSETLKERCELMDEYIKLNANLYGVDEIYNKDTLLIMKKDKQILVLAYPKDYDEVKLQSAIDRYIK